MHYYVTLFYVTQHLAILIVSYLPDFPLLNKLLLSIEKYNVDRFPTVLIVPKMDLREARRALPISVVDFLVEEESISSSIELGQVGNFRRGYIMQGIIKLNAWKLGIAKNYLSIDSDTYFIRQFDKSDFFTEDMEIYSVLSQEKYLRVEPSFRSFDVPRQLRIERIRSRVEVQDSRLLQSQVNSLLSSRVLESFTTDGLEFLNASYTSLFEEAPYEYGWYSFWLQKTKLVPVIPIEPIIYNFYTQGLYESAIRAGITEEDIARGFIGISKNSNWYKDYVDRNFFKRLKDEARFALRSFSLDHQL